MHKIITAVLVAMALLGSTACDAPASNTGGVATPTADRGAIAIEAIAEDFLDEQVAVIDIRIGSAKHADLAVGRVVWPNAKNRLVTISTRCDPADNLFSADARLVGLYDGQPGAVGEFGDPAPAGSVAIDGPLDQHIDVECRVGETFGYRFVFSVPSSQPAVTIDASVEAGVVGDALWTVAASAGDPAVELWQDRVTSGFWGDGRGGFGYPAPCSTYDASSSEMAVTVELLGLYAEPLPLVGDVGDPVPDGALEAWLPASLTHRVICEAGASAFAGFEVTVARVNREVGTRAAFAGVVCRAAWLCEDETSAVLDFACRAPGAQAPALYLDDLVVRCADGGSTTVDPTVGQVAEEVIGEVAWTSWRVPVDLGAATSARSGCVLSARGTAATRDRAAVEEPGNVFTSPLPGAWMKNGTVPEGAVYPVITWRIPLGGASAPACDDASLDLADPVTVTYTGSGDGETRFDHDSL